MTVPLGARRLLKNTDPSWSTSITHGTGHVEATTYGPARGDGTRPQLRVHVPCTSVAARLRHPDGRRAVALWSTRDGRKWTCEGAWAWTPPDIPRPLPVTALAELLAAGDELTLMEAA